MTHVKLVLGLAAATLVSAENIVTTLFIPDTDAESLAGSVMGVAATATTYFVNCPTATGNNDDDDDDDDCGMGPGMTIVAGPQTTNYFLGEPEDDVYMSMACSVQGITYGVCTEMISGTGADFTGTYTTTMGTDDLCCFVPVTITAGTLTGAGDAISPATVLATGTATPTIPDASATGTDTAISDKSATATVASTTTHDSTTQSSTGAAAFITHDSILLLGGAAAAVLVAVAL
ncbi:uncharacterized protein BO95DRAFT_424710 [Aspergillus brunneoviolaceus CBS 621.78]|uniref:Uncharacterized protein n=1 Tax=Aspergillus brunneoviolaceus CBS 621.78 TaxID=1450534 RepID=A0ACD1FTW7_9EURO|nr:hypothetical protein BO95DRAFT_424710 [Aspergillus brunneoviolaceus CBS 621.78]RAH40452.1 hypothetical protein BO95DRAFT_424710 [Aspergillus brunneoviolaceus CBS 621.78]